MIFILCIVYYRVYCIFNVYNSYITHIYIDGPFCEHNRQFFLECSCSIFLYASLMQKKIQKLEIQLIILDFNGNKQFVFVVALQNIGHSNFKTSLKINCEINIRNKPSLEARYVFCIVLTSDSLAIFLFFFFKKSAVYMI